MCEPCDGQCDDLELERMREQEDKFNAGLAAQAQAEYEWHLQEAEQT